MSGGRSFPWSNISWTISAPCESAQSDLQMNSLVDLHTALPNDSSAWRTNLPKRSRIRHSSTLTSRTSPSSSVCAWKRILCCTRTRMAARTVRGLRDVKRTNCESGRRPRVSRTDATFWSQRKNCSTTNGTSSDKHKAHCCQRAKVRMDYLNTQTSCLRVCHDREHYFFVSTSSRGQGHANCSQCFRYKP